MHHEMHRSRFTRLGLLLMILLPGLTLVAAPAPPAPSSAAPAPGRSTEPGADLTIYLLTLGPGDVIYERFGHNMIWVHDPSDPAVPDKAYNYGMFSFEEGNFVWKFLHG